MSSKTASFLMAPERFAMLALLTAWLPIVAINAAYLMAIAFDAVPRCLPYLDGCTSISSTGRTHPSQWVFKPLMLVSAFVMAWFFIASAQRTRTAAPKVDAVAVCGSIGALALVMYVVFLGTEGAVYRLLRRYGVSLYFGFVFLGQLLLARRLLGSSESAAASARHMLALCALLLVIGIGSIPITNFVAEKDQLENIIEWNFALLMQFNFLLARQAILALPPAVSRLSDE